MHHGGRQGQQQHDADLGRGQAEQTKAVRRDALIAPRQFQNVPSGFIGRRPAVQKRMHEEMNERLFPAWAMLDDEAPSLFWSAEDVAKGALEAASADTLLAPFIRLGKAYPG